VNETRTKSCTKCRLPDKDTGKKNKMQSISNQTPEGIVGNGGILEVTVTVNAGEENRGRQCEGWRVESGVESIKGSPNAIKALAAKRGTDLLRDGQNQRRCGVAGEVVMEEREREEQVKRAGTACRVGLSASAAALGQVCSNLRSATGTLR
jgi:hypothetical protein